MSDRQGSQPNLSEASVTTKKGANLEVSPEPVGSSHETCQKLEERTRTIPASCEIMSITIGRPTQGF